MHGSEGMSGPETYHIRIRGNVLGPFRRDQVLKMIERGQLTRRHDVSCDGSEWRPAGEIPELFAPQSSPADDQARSAEPNVVSQVPDAMLVQPASETVWYYEFDGRENGPVPVSQLTRLIATGVVGADHLVWRDGMADWQPVHATELAVHLPSRAASSPAEAVGRSPAVGAREQALSPKTVQLLLDIRLWSGIAAVCWSVLLVILFIIGFLGMLFAPLAGARVAAVLQLFGCIMWFVPLAYRFAANNAIGALKYTPSASVLDTVLGRWRTSYLWQGILTLITLAMIGISLIAAMAAGVDGPGW